MKRVLLLALCALLLAPIEPAAARPGLAFTPVFAYPAHRSHHPLRHRLHRLERRLALLEAMQGARVAYAIELAGPPAIDAPAPAPAAPAALIVVGRRGDANALCRASGFRSGARESRAGMTQTRCTR